MKLNKKELLIYPYSATKNDYFKIQSGVIESTGIQVDGFNYFNIANLLNKSYYVYLNLYENLPKEKNLRLIVTILKIFWIKIFRLQGREIICAIHNIKRHDDNKKGIFNIEWIIKNSHKVVLLSHTNNEYIKQIIKNKEYFYINHPNYCNMYEDSGRYSRNKLGIDNDCFVYLFDGAIKPYKNIELLIECFSELQLQKTRLIIAGECNSDEYNKSVNSLININKLKNRIIYLPNFILSDDLVSLINTSNITVFPYNNKSSLNSGSIMLSTSYGRTFISPKIGTVEEFIYKSREIEKDIFIYDYSNQSEHKEELIKAMKRAYNSWLDKSLEKKSHNIKSFVEKEYNSEVIANQIKIVLNETK